MKIWLLQTGELLPIKNVVRKMRTAILADKLLERGHSVLWWASAFEHQKKVMLSEKDRNIQISERYTIRVLRGCRYRKNISLVRYIDHQIVAFKFKMQSRLFSKPDIIVASMPDHLLAYEAARYAQKNGIPFLVDIRDLWPDIFLDRFRSIGLYEVGKIALAMDFAKLAFLLKNADSIVAMSKGILQWGLDKSGRTASLSDKVFYLGYKNNNSLKFANSSKNLIIPEWLIGSEEKKIFLFIGTFGVSYELELILDAAKHFEISMRSDISFVLAGTGEKFDLIKRKAAGLSNVVLPGWIGEKEIDALLSKGYVGLVPCRSVKDAMPNKSFEYLSAGLPLISSLEGEMVEIIEQYELGFNYRTGDLKGLFASIEHLASDCTLRDKMSQNASAFFKKYADADKIYVEYAQHIERIAQECKNFTRM